VNNDKVVGSWKRKQTKKVVKAAKKPIFRHREMKGTGLRWASQTFPNRAGIRNMKKHAKKERQLRDLEKPFIVALVYACLSSKMRFRLKYSPDSAIKQKLW
jgi:hypothetical protein